MNKLKTSNKSKIKSSNRRKKNTSEVLFSDNNKKKYFFYFLVCVLPFISAYNYYNYAFEINKFLSFPLDDPWIHLTFAKNLTEYFSFSYFKDEIVTAGSTSPLYTLTAALFFLFLKNEMLLSYILGVAFFSLASLFFYKLAKLDFVTENLIAFLCTGIFILDKWMNFISLSGMETSLFIFLLLLGSYYYKTRKAIPLSITLGLIIWTRPDGIAFVAAVILTYTIERYFFKKNKEIIFFKPAEIRNIIIVFLTITGLYCVMNYSLSGSILPNTYNAKVAYFIDMEKRMSFLTDKVWLYFTDGYCFLLMTGFIFTIGKFIFDLYKRNYHQNTLYILFIFVFLLIYWVKLPAILRFGRYAMPMIPFFILLSVAGFRDMIKLVSNLVKITFVTKIAFLILIIFIFVLSFKDYETIKVEYQKQCKYLYDRQVKTAQWIKKFTNENDIIATHDIGAIGFYSERKIIDVAGLINLELNAKLNEYDYSKIMTEYFINHGVSYLAFMEEWYYVSNQLPVFGTPEFTSDENMYVYILSR